MAFNVSTFRTNFKYDGARANLFEVDFTVPLVGATSTEKYKLMVRGASLPGKTIGAINTPYFGNQWKAAGNLTFPDWTITIINKENFGVREDFERWMQSINGASGNIRSANRVSPSSYKVPLHVKQFGKAAPDSIHTAGEGAAVIAQYRFEGAFPTDLSDIALDWGTTDAIEEFTVTFAYDWWSSTFSAAPSATAVAGSATAPDGSSSVDGTFA
tara:strand:- start:107 stop:748 length:642 start_codon:yes stop_codon:yes gene_type:complete